MTNNIWTTVLALAIYLTSSGGGKSSPTQPWTPPPSSIGQQNPGYSGKSVRISTELANLRQAGQSTSTVIGTLSKGTALTVEGEKKGWYNVRTAEGQSGWIARWMTQPSTAVIPVHTNSSWEVVGYYAEDYQGNTKGYSSFTNNLDKITSVAPFSYHVDRYGNIQGQHPANLLSVAQARGIQTLALVNNTQSNSFSSRTIDQMLSSSTSRSRAISGILRLLTEHGYSGVNIDFEGVPARDRSKLTFFFQELSIALRSKNLLVTASLPAKAQEDYSSSWGGAYDYAALSPYLDRAIIMTYDQHYKDGPAGPVAAINWVENVVQYTSRFFPVNRIIMGVAAYGYDWTSRSGKALTYSGIQNLLRRYQVAPSWSSAYQSPYFTYNSGGTHHEVWYEDSNSAAAKVRLAAKYGLRGVAIWKLGYEDPNLWNVI